MTELRRLAEAATPGPWRYPVGGALIGAEGDVVVELGLRDRDGRYLAAASPDVILALLDRLDKLDVDRLYEAMVWLDNDDPGAFNIVAISEPDTRPVAAALAQRYAALSAESGDREAPAE